MSSPFESIKDGMISVLANNATLSGYVSANWSTHIFRNLYLPAEANLGRTPLINIGAVSTSLKDKRGSNIYVSTNYNIRAIYNDTTPKDRGTWEDALTTFTWDIIKALATSENGFGYGFVTNHYPSNINFDTSNHPLLVSDTLYTIEWFYDQESIS